jgi:hypothetical protein
MSVTVELVSVLTCPHCGHATAHTMPTNACIIFADCEGCGQMLRPKLGDCCIYCSYGSVACPPIQEARSCCGSSS